MGATRQVNTAKQLASQNKRMFSAGESEIPTMIRNNVSSRDGETIQRGISSLKSACWFYYIAPNFKKLLRSMYLTTPVEHRLPS